MNKPQMVKRWGLTNTHGDGFTDRYLGVVLHIMGGSLAGCDSWFDNPVARTRVNFGIDWQGEIHEYYDVEGGVRGFQHGIIQQPVSTNFARLQVASNWRNPNYWLVGIEHEDKQGGNVATQFAQHPAMFEASTDLTAWLCQRFGIPPNVQHILGHCEIAAIDRSCCPMCEPGREAMFDRYVSRVREKLGEQEETDLSTPEALLRAARAMNREQLGELNNILQQGKLSIEGAPTKAKAPTLYAKDKTQYHDEDDITRGLLDHWAKDNIGKDGGAPVLLPEGEYAATGVMKITHVKGN